MTEKDKNYTRCDRCGIKSDTYWMVGHLKFCKKCRRIMIRLLELWLSGKLNKYLKDIGLWKLYCKTGEMDYYDPSDSGSSQYTGKSVNLIVIDDIGGDKK